MDSHGNSKGAQMTVVIAVRGGADAKSRLRPVLGKAGCSALVGAMLGDMVAALQSSATVGRIIVVTPTPELANGLGVEILADPQQGGINAAFAHANRIISGPALHLPGDLPELDAASIDALVEQVQAGGRRAGSFHNRWWHRGFAGGRCWGGNVCIRPRQSGAALRSSAGFVTGSGHC
jgi:CTP:molybdopterin cytidylyltransferase MocA